MSIKILSEKTVSRGRLIEIEVNNVKIAVLLT
jgi:hypothetical protein